MERTGTRRARTVTWEDPQVSRRDAAAISGLDYLIAVKEGRIEQPPAARLIGYRFASVHGGIMGTLLDSAMAAAVLSTLPVGVGCLTLELKINYVRPVTADVGTLRCEGSVIHAGSSIATAEARLLDSGRKLYAHAVSTCSLSSAV